MIPVLIAVLYMTTASAQENIDESCFHCHPAQVNEFQTSVHFNKNTCADCHGGDINISGNVVSINVMHTNFTGKPSSVNVTNFCSKCHEDETRIYKESIHWQDSKREDLQLSCTDCHGIHNILSSKNTNSSTFSANIPGNMRKNAMRTRPGCRPYIMAYRPTGSTLTRNPTTINHM